jgi:hypothetical protein
MAVAGDPIRDDQILVRYLLGSLPEDQAERLDELSVTDDDFVWRFRAAENDLVDAFLRNELSGDNLERFQSHYLSSSLRREKVQFAAALLALRTQEAPSAGRWFTKPMLIPRWAFGAAVAAALLLGAILLYDNTQLRNGVQEHKQEAAAQDTAITVAMVLAPPLRGAGKLPELIMPPGTGRVMFDLQLETDDLPVYRLVLKAPAADTPLWRSEALQAHPSGSRRALSVTIPANLLDAGIHILQLSGDGQDTVPIADYTFKVVSK